MEQKIYKLRVVSIDTLEKIFYRIKYEPLEVFHFEIQAQAVGYQAVDILGIIVSVEVKKEADKSIVAAKVTAEFRYNVEDLEKSIIKGEGGKLSVPPELENILKMMSISTMRGIMYSEFRGTPLHHAILPVVGVDSFTPIEGSLAQ